MPEYAQSLSYTCPMHPQIKQKNPGFCPICSMDLVIFRPKQVGLLTLNARQIALAAITVVGSLRKEFIRPEISSQNYH